MSKSRRLNDTLLRRPADVATATWFAGLADLLLRRVRMIAGGKPHRLVEIECYLFAEDHPDPFTFRHPRQRPSGRWFFHRTGNTYRNGSFKGLDLTIGASNGLGGVLIRSLETPDGSLVVGPSLCVDYLLARSKARTIAELDAATGTKAIWDVSNPLALQKTAAGEDRIFQSARIGLSLKKPSRLPHGYEYIMSPYRFLTEPRRIGKGKCHLVLALHEAGFSAAQIREITGSPRKSIERYLEDFEIGRKEADFARYVGVDLGPRELCRLHGVWHARFAASPQRA